MKRFTMFVAAGIMGLLLAACGEQPKAPVAKTEVIVEQPAAKAESAAPEAPATTEESTNAAAAGAEKQE